MINHATGKKAQCKLSSALMLGVLKERWWRALRAVWFMWPHPCLLIGTYLEGRKTNFLVTRGSYTIWSKAPIMLGSYFPRRTGGLELSLNVFWRVCSQVLEETVQTDRRFRSKRADKWFITATLSTLKEVRFRVLESYHQVSAGINSRFSWHRWGFLDKHFKEPGGILGTQL